MKYKTLVSTLAVIVSSSFFSPVSAQSVDDLKKQSLAACEAQSAQLSGEQKATVMAVCKCTVENTDYDQLIKDAQAGNAAKVQEDATKVAQECQANMEKKS